MKSPSKFLYTVIFFVSFVLVFFVGFYIGAGGGSSTETIQTLFGKEAGKPSKVDFQIFWDTWNLLEEQYVAEDLDYQKMVYGAVSGLVRSLEDPYSVFLSPEDSKEFQDDISGKFEGIGAEIGIRKGALVIVSPLKNSPAERAGLRPSDTILKIDDTITLDLSLEEAVRKIRGPHGTQVRLTILRGNAEEPSEIFITREVIEVPSLAWELKEGKIAYIEIYNFNENLVADFHKAATEILASGADRIILDVRNNPGGLLDASVKVAGYFLEKGSVVVIEESREGKREERTDMEGPFKSFPVVLLVNEGSASASEILAGALRDNRGIRLVGGKTFGKGSVQTLEALAGGSHVKLTIARWLTPSGASIHDVGLEPDERVEHTEEDFKEERDPQFDKAFELIKTL